MLLAVAAQATAFGPAGVSAEAPPPMAVEIHRGFVAVNSTSEQPALRLERETREPSPGFMLGASLGAWKNAAESLKYHLENPSGDGDDTATIDLDCYEERVAFTNLDVRRQASGLDARDIVGAASVVDLLPALQARLTAAPPRCR